MGVPHSLLHGGAQAELELLLRFQIAIRRLVHLFKLIDVRYRAPAKETLQHLLVRDLCVGLVQLVFHLDQGKSVVLLFLVHTAFQPLFLLVKLV